MARSCGDRSKEVRYIYELPFTERNELCTILDINNQWEKLGGQYMGYTVLQLQKIKNSEKCGESPTNNLLHLWGRQNNTVAKLYKLLYDMEHYQAMRVLLPFIPKHHHHLALRGDFSLTSMLGNIDINRQRSNTNSTNNSASRNTTLPADMMETLQRHSERLAARGLRRNNSNSSATKIDAAQISEIQTSTTSNSITVHQAQANSTTLDSTITNNIAHNLNANKDAVIPDKVPKDFLLLPTSVAAQTNQCSNLRNVSSNDRISSSANKDSLPKRQTCNDNVPNLMFGETHEERTTDTVSTEDNNKNNYGQNASAVSSDIVMNYGPETNPNGQGVNTTTSYKHLNVDLPLSEPNTNQSPEHSNLGAIQPIYYPDNQAVAPATNFNKDDDSTTSSQKSKKISKALEGTNIHQIPYKELEEATIGWKPDQIVGKGGFGVVYRGSWKKTQVAIKRVHNQSCAMTQSTIQALEELKILLSYRHDNILQVYGYSFDEDKPLCIVYQFMPNGSVEDRLHCRAIDAFEDKSLPPRHNIPLTWIQRLVIAQGIAAALQYLHSVRERPLIHGDVKSANILLDYNFKAKLGDFGLAREGPSSQLTSIQVLNVQGSRPYVPDEYYRSKILSKKVDTYAYGVVMFELCTGLRASDEKRKQKYLKDYIEMNSENINNLIDPKLDSGSDCYGVFPFLYKIGNRCVARKSKRPDMEEVFEDIEDFIKLNRPLESERMSTIDSWNIKGRMSQNTGSTLPSSIQSRFDYPSYPGSTNTGMFSKHYYNSHIGPTKLMESPHSHVPYVQNQNLYGGSPQMPHMFQNMNIISPNFHGMYNYQNMGRPAVNMPRPNLYGSGQAHINQNRYLNPHNNGYMASFVPQGQVFNASPSLQVPAQNTMNQPQQFYSNNPFMNIPGSIRSPAHPGAIRKSSSPQTPHRSINLLGQMQVPVESTESSIDDYNSDDEDKENEISRNDIDQQSTDQAINDDLNIYDSGQKSQAINIPNMDLLLGTKSKCPTQESMNHNEENENKITAQGKKSLFDMG